MKLAYIYLNDLNKNTANVHQMLNMASAFASLVDITVISSWISKKSMEERLSFFSLTKNFGHKRIPIVLVTKNFFVEKLSRLFYAFFVLVHIKFNKYDIIYTRDFSFLLFLSYLPQWIKPKQKIIFEFHTIYHKSSSKVSFQQEKRALEIPVLFIPISKGIKTDLMADFNIEEQKIYVAPDGVNINLFENLPDRHLLREKYGIDNAESVIIYSGTFKKWKGVDYLVKAYAKLVNIDRCKNTRLILVGGSTKDIGTIERLIDDLCIDKKNIIIKGFVSQNEMIKLLALSDIGVIPNTKTAIGGKYTSPLKLFEYMAAGLAIIASDLPAMREVLDDGNAFFFEAEDSEDLTDKMCCLIGDVEKRRKMRHNNLIKIGTFAWDKRAKRILKKLRLLSHSF